MASVPSAEDEACCNIPLVHYFYPITGSYMVVISSFAQGINELSRIVSARG